MFVYLVTDHIRYDGDDVIAGFTKEDAAIAFADKEPLYTDMRTISKLELDSPDESFLPVMTEYRRYRRF